MKISTSMDNPAPYQQVMKALKAAEKAGIKSATVSFRTWESKDYGGGSNGKMVELTIEGDV